MTKSNAYSDIPNRQNRRALPTWLIFKIFVPIKLIYKLRPSHLFQLHLPQLLLKK